MVVGGDVVVVAVDGDYNATIHQHHHHCQHHNNNHLPPPPTRASRKARHFGNDDDNVGNDDDVGGGGRWYWSWMNVMAERSRGQSMDLTALKFNCLQRSVLCRGGCTCNYCHGFYLLGVVAFSDLMT